MDTTEALSVLGLGEGTDLAAVRAAYRDLVRTTHPDVAPDDERAHARTARLTEAYEVAVAYLEAREHIPAPPRSAEPPPPPPTPETEPLGVVEPLDETTIAVAAPAAETYAALYEAAGRVGEIAYYDRRLGILEIIVRFQGGPSCSVVMNLRPGVHQTEVLCTMESIEAAPTPPIAPVVDALVAELRVL